MPDDLSYTTPDVLNRATKLAKDNYKSAELKIECVRLATSVAGGSGTTLLEEAQRLYSWVTE